MLHWLPENIATYGAEIDRLFYRIYYITGAALLLVTVLLVAFLAIYRQRPGRRARYSHGSTALEMTWTIVSALILVVLTFLSISTWSTVKGHVPESDLHVRITAKQFNWEVTYPGPDGKFDTADDVTLDNEVHAPVGKAVILHLRSKDVIHSVFIPNARFQQDAVPGREILQWIEITKPGKYEIPVASVTPA
jgi:cytochrome c oxidase subunit II